MATGKDHKYPLKKVESEIKKLEKQLAASEDKLIVSNDSNNPFIKHRQSLIDRIETAKRKIEIEKLKDKYTVKREEINAPNIEPPEDIIKRNLTKLGKKILAVKLEIKFSGRGKTKLEEELKELTKQKLAFEEKRKILVEAKKKSKQSEQLKPSTSVNKKEKKRKTATKPIKVSSKPVFSYKFLIAKGKVLENLIVDWDSIFFEDGRIKFRLDKRRFVWYPCNQSRSSYEYIKLYLKRKEIEPLQLQVSNERVRSIANLDLLHDAIQILKIKIEWNKMALKESAVDVSSILRSLGSLSSKAFDYFYKNKNLTPYLRTLCEIQELDYHIIPVLEPVNSNYISSLNVNKESFLFTIRRTNVYIIWESIEVNKATFIFTTKEATYLEDLQKIFDYISSHLRNKRTNLRKGIINEDGQHIQSHRTLYHTTLEKWTEKLFEFLI